MAGRPSSSRMLTAPSSRCLSPRVPARRRSRRLARPLVASEPATVLPPARDDGHLPALATPLGYALSFDVDPRTTSVHGDDANRRRGPRRRPRTSSSTGTALDRHRRARGRRRATSPTTARTSTRARARREAVPTRPRSSCSRSTRRSPAGRATLVIDVLGAVRRRALRPLPRDATASAGTRSRSSSRPTRAARFRASTSRGSRSRSTSRVTRPEAR